MLMVFGDAVTRREKSVFVRSGVTSRTVITWAYITAVMWVLVIILGTHIARARNHVQNKVGTAVETRSFLLYAIRKDLITFIEGLRLLASA